MARGSRYFFGPAGRFFLGCIVFACASLTKAADGPPHRVHHLLVAPRSGANGRLDSFRKSHGHRLRNRFEHLGGIQVIDVRAGEDPMAKAEEYKASGLVDFAEPDYPIYASATPNDPRLTNCWGLINLGQNGGKIHADINATSAWDVQNSAENVIVAIIDSGVRYTHEDLAANMWHNPGEIPANGIDDDGNGLVDDVVGFNAINHTGDPYDDLGHGTHVAGIIGAVANNGEGIAGVCWKVRMMALKFMDDSGFGDTSDAIACIDYARAHGAKVINASWGSGYGGMALRNAISAARNAGIIVVAAAGNEQADNDEIPTYPANYSSANIVSVAAIDDRDELDEEYSNYGARTVDIAAPGSAIYSTWNSSDTAYRMLSGTSMATPYVTGAVALLRAAFPDEPYTSIISRLYAGADKLPGLAGKCVTGARLNIGNLFHQTAANEGVTITGVQTTEEGTIRLLLSDTATAIELETSTDLTAWEPVDPSTMIASGQQVDISPRDSHCAFFRIRASEP